MAIEPDDSGLADELSEEFRVAFARELRGIGLTVTRWDADGLECISDDGETRSLGLANLWRRARKSEPDQWPEMIREFLSVVVQQGIESAESPDSLDDAADRLMVRVGQPFALSSDVVPWQMQLTGTDLVINLVIDSERYMMYVTRELMEKSAQPPGDWLDRALQNLRERTPEDYLQVLDEESGIIWGCLSDSYDASRALILSELLDEGPAGTLVCIPNRDLLFALSVRGETLRHFPLMKVLAERNFEREPYPISNQVYWVRGRKWEVFSIEVGEQVTITPSEEFMQALELASFEEPEPPEQDRQ